MTVQVRRMLGPEPRFVYFIYSFLMGLVAIALLPYWLVQGLRYGKYLSNLPERLGFSFPSLEKLPADRAGAMWIHTVSVGEALSSVTLARQLKEAYPNRPLIVSTATITGNFTFSTDSVFTSPSTLTAFCLIFRRPSVTDSARPQRARSLSSFTGPIKEQLAFGLRTDLEERKVRLVSDDRLRAQGER